ncbi:hypothetical protein RDI58_019870 [Solanum bulbocastanum]|uniref:Uncharacterized protein n=1 Tax=Solanum bulbocastanum TaxID=147425 RepID=A0AAN8T8X7_SOLBU
MVKEDDDELSFTKVIAYLGLYAIVLGLDAGLDSIDNYRKHRNLEKEQNAIKKEQNAMLQALRETSQQREDHILAKRESCFPRHSYNYSTPLSGISLVEIERKKEGNK